MIFDLTTRRNSIHPAWLLLLVPPLARSVADWSNDNPAEFVLDGFRLLGALAVLLFLFWLRSHPVSGRPVRLLKDLRTLMPGSLVAILVPGIAFLNGERDAVETGSWFFTFGCLLMGASTFGAEFEQRTIAGLLGQPVSRGTLYREKLSMLGGMLFVATIFYTTGAASVSSRWPLPSDWHVFLWVPVFVFCSATLFSLLSRSTLAGLVFTLATPFLAGISVMLVLQTGYRFSHPGEALPETWAWWLFGIGIPAYLIGTSWLGWRVFRGLEVRDGGAGGRSSNGLHPLSLPMDALLGRLSSSTGGTGRLLRKELRLHVVPWLVAGLMLGMWVLWMVLRRTTTDEGLRSTLDEVPTLTIFMGILGALIVVTTGAASVAEERELGTLEWQLTQPVSVRRQWWTKVAVVAALALGLGVLLPATLVWASFNPERLQTAFGDVHILVVAAYAGSFLLVFATSVYASSFSRNTMTAVAEAVGVGALLSAMGYAGTMFVRTSLDEAVATARMTWETSPVPVVAPDRAPTVEGLIWTGIALVAVSGLVPFVGMLWMGMRNFRRVGASFGTVARQLLVIIVVSFLVMWAGALGMRKGVLLVEQSSWVEESERKAQNRKTVITNAVLSVEAVSKAGLLHPSYYIHAGVPTSASPQELVDAVLAHHGMDRLYMFTSVRIAMERADTLVAAIPQLRELAAAGRLTPSLLKQHQIVAGSTPEEIAESLLARRGTVGLQRFVKDLGGKLRTPSLEGYWSDPALARRYDLLIPLGSNGYNPTPFPRIRFLNSSSNRLDPEMAKRYGLIPDGSTDDAATQTNLPAASTNPPIFKMDPALMKRYGLQPRPSP